VRVHETSYRRMQLLCDGAGTNSLLIGTRLALHMYHNKVTHGSSIRLGCRNSRISILVAVFGTRGAVSLRVLGSSGRGAIQNTREEPLTGIDKGIFGWSASNNSNFLKDLVVLCLLRIQMHVNNYLSRLFGYSSSIHSLWKSTMVR